MNDMDIAAKHAETEIAGKLDKLTAKEIAVWWAKHYRTAGHKRLGRTLLKLAQAA